MSTILTIAGTFGKISTTPKPKPDQSGQIYKIRSQSNMLQASWRLQGDSLVLGDYKGTITNLNLIGNRYTVMTRGCTGATALSYADESVLVGHSSSRVSVFSIGGGMAKNLTIHRNTIRNFSINHLRKTVVSCSSDQVAIWNAENWTRIRSLFPQTKDLIGAQVAPNSQSLYVCYANSSIVQLNMGNFEIEAQYQLPWRDTITAFCVRSDMGILYAACGHGLVVWDCVEKQVQTVLKYPACTEGIQKMT